MAPVVTSPGGAPAAAAVPNAPMGGDTRGGCCGDGGGNGGGGHWTTDDGCRGRRGIRGVGIGGGWGFDSGDGLVTTIYRWSTSDPHCQVSHSPPYASVSHHSVRCWWPAFPYGKTCCGPFASRKTLHLHAPCPSSPVVLLPRSRPLDSVSRFHFTPAVLLLCPLPPGFLLLSLSLRSN